MKNTNLKLTLVVASLFSASASIAAPGKAIEVKTSGPKGSAVTESSKQGAASNLRLEVMAKSPELAGRIQAQAAQDPAFALKVQSITAPLTKDDLTKNTEKAQVARYQLTFLFIEKMSGGGKTKNALLAGLENADASYAMKTLAGLNPTQIGKILKAEPNLGKVIDAVGRKASNLSLRDDQKLLAAVQEVNSVDAAKASQQVATLARNIRKGDCYK